MSVKGRVAFYIVGIFLAATGFLLYGYSPYFVTSGAELIPASQPVNSTCRQEVRGMVTVSKNDPESRILVGITAPVAETVVEETVFAHEGRYVIPINGTPEPEARWQVEVIHYGATGPMAQVKRDITGVMCNDTVQLDVSL